MFAFVAIIPLGFYKYVHLRITVACVVLHYGASPKAHREIKARGAKRLVLPLPYRRCAIPL